VIIAKLKFGFVTTGFEVSDEWGVVVKRSYYINKMRDGMIRYSTVEVHPTREVKKILKLKS